jgi:hypothetical protein
VERIRVVGQQRSVGLFAVHHVELGIVGIVGAMGILGIVGLKHSNGIRNRLG